MAASSRMYDRDLGEIGPSAKTSNHRGTADITHMMERTKILKDDGGIDDNELSKIGSGVGPNELQKIAVRYLKVPQPAIDTYKASARYEKVY